MENLSNINYDPIEVYSNSKELELDTSLDKFDPNMEDLTKNNKLINNPTSINPVYTIKSSDFESLYSPYVASKQTQIVIWNKSIIKVDEMLNKVYVDF